MRIDGQVTQHVNPSSYAPLPGTAPTDTSKKKLYLDVQLVVPAIEGPDQGGLLHRPVLVHEEDVDGPALFARAHSAHSQLGHAVAWCVFL